MSTCCTTEERKLLAHNKEDLMIDNLIALWFAGNALFTSVPARLYFSRVQDLFHLTAVTVHRL